ncbi:hypothetical protein KKF91_16400 [Myxococcota bacterium]|nr:hypothetical protein [Myxococcota bacterium]MBU1432117.1 hypothetical protein [Myxococcota bacterium]MBU1900330.1 hypothetical protein [Myxococcota bacterium]
MSSRRGPLSFICAFKVSRAQSAAGAAIAAEVISSASESGGPSGPAISEARSSRSCGPM